MILEGYRLFSNARAGSTVTASRATRLRPAAGAANLPAQSAGAVSDASTAVQ